MKYQPGPLQKIRDVEVGEGVVIQDFVNLYQCRLGAGTRVGPFTEIQKDVVIGERCKVSSHCLICTGVTIEDEVFVGHGVIFTNDRYPRSTNTTGTLQNSADWRLERIYVKRGASIGSGAVILCGVTIGEGAMVGAGAVITKDVPDGATVAGNPARATKRVASRV
jgi:UDP-2-acetamido-3-amino-2,3-dideoxy-glucuronate N-acetyltransferase